MFMLIRGLVSQIFYIVKKLFFSCFLKDEAQKRLRELQAEADVKGAELFKCQEECSRVVQQLVNGQQKMKELTIENLDMKETLKASNEVQKELTSEVGRSGRHFYIIVI